MPPLNVLADQYPVIEAQKSGEILIPLGPGNRKIRSLVVVLELLTQQFVRAQSALVAALALAPL